LASRLLFAVKRRIGPDYEPAVGELPNYYRSNSPYLENEIVITLHSVKYPLFFDRDKEGSHSSSLGQLNVNKRVSGSKLKLSDYLFTKLLQPLE
jgi:hypothetical protein